MSTSTLTLSWSSLISATWPEKVGERAGLDLDGVVDLELVRRHPALGHRRLDALDVGPDDVVDLAARERGRAGLLGADEPGDPRGRADDVEDLGVRLAAHQQVAREHPLRDGRLLAALELGDVLFGHVDLVDLVGQLAALDDVVERADDLLLVAGEGVHDVPAARAVVGRLGDRLLVDDLDVGHLDVGHLAVGHLDVDDLDVGDLGVSHLDGDDLDVGDLGVVGVGGGGQVAQVGLLVEQEGHELREAVAEAEDQRGHEDQDPRARSTCSSSTSGRVGQATWRISSRTSRKNWRGLARWVRARRWTSWTAVARREGAAPSAPIWPCRCINALLFAVHLTSLFALVRCRLRAGQEGLEPPTPGFGDRCSTN